MLGSLIGAGASLLGGLFGNSSEKKRAKQERKWALEDQAQYFIRNRAAAESAGFNPLAAMGMFQGTAQTSAAGGNFMGNAIADAGLMIADGLEKRKEENGRIAQLEAANQKLQDRIVNMTIRPKVGGIYAGNYRTLSLGAARGVNDDAQGYILGGAIPVPDPTLDRASGLFLAGKHIEGAPGYSPASVFEENYGDSEIGQTFYLGAKVGADAGHNVDRAIFGLRAKMDQAGLTEPGTDYWKKWPYLLDKAMTAPNAPPRKAKGFWDTYWAGSKFGFAP